MSNNIKVYDTVESLAKSFTAYLIELLSKKKHGEKLTIALSGGSTPKAIFEYMARHAAEKINWEQVLLFWGDERCVPPDDPESNFKMTKDILLDSIQFPDTNVFRIQGELPVEEAANRYSQRVLENVPEAGGSPQFDLVLLGLGDDGHTASIFPDQIDLYDNSNLFVPAKNPYSGQERVSATGRVIDNANSVVFLVTGGAKTTVLSEIIHKKGDWQKHPASKVSVSKGNLSWYVDSAAGAGLK